MTRLEAIQTLAQLDAFSADAYLDGLRAAVPGGTTLDALDETDAALRAALDAIDRFTATAMRILLDAGLANDASVPPTFRRTLAATVLQYERDRDTLRERVAMVAARTDPAGASTTADVVGDAAGRALGVRAALRDGVLAIARAHAAAHLPAARQRAWDRAQDEAAQARWAAVVLGMEQLLGVPAEEAPEPVEPTRGELIEYD